MVKAQSAAYNNNIQKCQNDSWQDYDPNILISGIPEGWGSISVKCKLLSTVILKTKDDINSITINAQ